MENIRKSIPFVLACLLAATVAVPVPGSGARAAEPSSGRLAPDRLRVEWKGPEKTSAGQSPLKCGDPGFYCDDFSLHVDVPADYWQSDTEGVLFEVTWGKPTDVFRLCVKGSGDEKFKCETTTPDDEVGKLTIFSPRASGLYAVQVRYESVVEGAYQGEAEIFRATRLPPEVTFVDDSFIAFGPASVVSPHFLGTEPMLEIERPTPTTTVKSLDSNRLFVDWPMGSSSQIGQLNRSEDGGDSFRLLFDMKCASRSRPNCGTGGGGDTDVAVDPSTGHVFFTDLEFPANVAVASSTDHGDTFPAEREHSISNAMGAIDRQWVTGVPAGLVSVDHDDVPTTPSRPVEAFISYHAGLLTQTVQAIDDTGRPVPQPEPQIVDRSTSKGPLRIDGSNGPGRGWLYLPTGDEDQEYGVATVKAENYRSPQGDPGGWRTTTIPEDSSNIALFHWLALDTRGNAYTVYTQKAAARDVNGVTVSPWTVRYSYSDIDHPANNPHLGGRPGSLWSIPVEISLPNATTIFPEIIAGDEGRVAVTYMAAENFHGDPAEAPADARWNVHAAILPDAMAENGPLSVRTGRVSHRVVHTGPICRDGTTCEASDEGGGGDRSLAEMIDIGLDADGRLGVVFSDNNSGFAYISGTSKDKPFVHFAKQVSGLSLLANRGDISIDVPSDSRSDLSGDSDWPNRADGGTYLQALDLRNVSLHLDGTDVVAEIGLTDASGAGMDRDLRSYRGSYPASAAPAERLQYAMRFLTDSDIFHLSMEHTVGGTRRFFAGKLGDNDRLAFAGGEGIFATQGAGYHTDADIPVLGTVEDNIITLRAPAAALGLNEGSRLFSATAFAMAGPLEASETSIQNIMRTVDASPPFDATLAQQQTENAPTTPPTQGSTPTADPTPSPEPTPTPTASPTADPTPTPSPQPTGTPPPDPTGRCDIVGTSGNDYLPGTDADETICGRGGDDVLVGAGGDDTLLGGSGDDRLFGQAGNDLLNGRRGSDELRGGRGHDVLLGRPQNDDLFGGRGNDALRGGRGRDHCRGGPGRNRRSGCERSPT